MCITPRQKREQKAFLAAGERAHITLLDLGCGDRPAAAGSINVDASVTPAVHVAAGLEDLPFCSETADAVYISGVLEHLRAPVRVVDEIHRILKAGGQVYAAVPFVNRMHGAPQDYQRYTEEGLKELFRRFHDCRTGVLAGPASALCDTARHFLALLFSFRSHGAYLLLYRYFFAYLTLPLKYFDYLLDRHPDSPVIAAAYYLVGRKGSEPAETDDLRTDRIDGTHHG